MAAQPFILTIDCVRPFCYSNWIFAVNPKEKDNEIIELRDEELEEIFADDDFDNGEDDAEIRSFYFSNPDPYAKVKPRPGDAPRGSFLSMKMAALL